MIPGDLESKIVIVLSAMASVGALTLLPAFWFTERRKFSLGDLLATIFCMATIVTLTVMILQERRCSPAAVGSLTLAEVMGIPSALVLGASNRNRLVESSALLRHAAYFTGVGFMLSLFPAILLGIFSLDLIPRQIDARVPPESLMIYIVLGLFMIPVLAQGTIWFGVIVKPDPNAAS